MNPRLRCFLLGGLRVRGPDGPLELPGGIPRRLLAYLLLSSAAPHPRERLAGLLWPDAPPDRAGRNLSNALYRLRKTIGAALQADDDQLTLSAGPDVWVDAREFERLAHSADPSRWEQAIALYTGDLLPEVYDDWVLPPRLALRELYLRLLQQLGERAEADRDWSRAADHYRRLAAADPLREAAHRGLMRALAALGREPEALEVYAGLADLLTRELSVPPAAETRALAEHLQRELALSRAADPWRGRPPFVGRVGERAQLITRVEQARTGHGGLAALVGEAGLGKTRLLEEIAQSAEWRGWQVAWGRGDEFNLPAPYAPFSLALQGAVSPVRAQQLARLVEPHWLQLLAGLIPALQPHISPLTALARSDAGQTARAVGRLLAGLAQIQPQLLLLDDVQWAAPDMWPLLDGLRPHLQGAPVLLVLSGRPDEWRAQPAAWQWLDQGDRRGELLLRLDGLTVDELRELVAAQAGPALAAGQLEQLHAATAGNPLLALELAQAGDIDSLLRARPGLADLALQRLGALSADARLALEAASALGRRFDYTLWEGLLLQAGFAADHLPAAAGELEQAGLLRLEASGYAFAHDTLRAAIYHHASAAPRTQWHTRALAVLEARPGGDPIDCLYHARQAGPPDAIARHAYRAGERALASCAYRAAADFYAEALAALPAEATRARFAARRGRAEALRVLADRQTLPGDLQALRELADTLEAPTLQAEAALQHARFSWQTGDFEAAWDSAARGLALAVDDKMRADLEGELGRVARDRGDYADAQAWFEKARAHYEAANDPAGLAAMHDLLGIVAQRQGQPRAARPLHAEAVQRFRGLGDLRSEAHALSNLGVAHWMLGDYPAARAAFERVADTSRALGDVRAETAALNNLGSLAGLVGDYEHALEAHTAALSLARAAADRPSVAHLLGGLGYTRHTLGQTKESLAAFEEALRLNRDLGRRRGEGYVLHGLGEALLDDGRASEARAAFEAAQHIRAELAERDNLVVTRACLAAACLAQDDLAGAEAALQAALRDLDESQDSPEARRDVHFRAYQVLAALGQTGPALQHLHAAEDALRAIADRLTPEERARFLKRVPGNRRVLAALAQHARPVRLARAEAPLGRPLAEADFVDVRWTVRAPADDAVSGKAARRRHILKRLLAEAREQGAAPTDADLARALGVSRRTIERDMAALQTAGQSLPTRRRR